MPERPETLLAFDFGTVRIGVALGNTLTRQAGPLTTVDNRVADRGFEAIGRILTEWQPQRLVVGRPLHPDGTPHEMTARCERFARRLEGRFGVPVSLVDERYSSVEAQSQSPAQSRAQSRSQVQSQADETDAEAAAIILRQYLSETAPLPGGGAQAAGSTPTTTS